MKKSGFELKQRSIPDLPICENSILRGKMTSQSTLDCSSHFLHYLKTTHRRNAVKSSFLGDSDQMLSNKDNFYNNLNLVDDATSDLAFKHFY